MSSTSWAQLGQVGIGGPDILDRREPRRRGGELPTWHRLQRRVAVLAEDPGAHHHAGRVEPERRFTKGFTLLSSFTWSHNIDHAGELLNNNEGNSFRDHYNPGADRASSNQDRRLIWATSYVFELLFGKGKKWLSRGPGAWILGVWQMGGILNFMSGRPLSHTINVNRENNNGVVRGNWVS